MKSWFGGPQQAAEPTDTLSSKALGALVTPAAVTRTPESLTLYFYPSCAFCYRVRAEAAQLGVALLLADIHQNPTALAELVRVTRRQTVPVLRIAHPGGPDQWLPESRDIVDYLREITV
jgi:glutaredoxin